MIINHNEAKILLENIRENSPNEIFSVNFKKRSGELRKINCRFNVRKFLKGGERKYDPSDHNLICVADMALIRKGEIPYRSIPIEGITKINTRGQVYDVV
jgi:hypothetical protein